MITHVPCGSQMGAAQVRFYPYRSATTVMVIPGDVLKSTSRYHDVEQIWRGAFENKAIKCEIYCTECGYDTIDEFTLEFKCNVCGESNLKQYMALGTRGCKKYPPNTAAVCAICAAKTCTQCTRLCSTWTYFFEDHYDLMRRIFNKYKLKQKRRS